MWTVEFTHEATKDFRKLTPQTRQAITKFMRKLVEDCPHPRVKGKVLSYRYKGIWRYRVGDYRIMCELDDTKQLIEVLGIGHRREVYR